MRRFGLILLGVSLALPVAARAQRVDPGASFLDEAPAPMAAPRSGVATGLSEGIAAVVNDNVITTADVRDRMALALLSAGLPDSPEVRQRLMPQVLRGLMDEQLQLQEGKRLDINLTERDIDEALKRIADDNKIPGGDMVAFVRAHGVSPTALKAQVRAGLTWAKVVQRELRPKIDIGDDEIDAVAQRMQANAGKDEYLLSEIVLPVDSTADEDQVKAFADKLVQEIKGGAIFGAVARQFSQGAGAASGGDVGWVQEGQLGADIDQAMQSMQPGEVRGPVRTANGYHILGLRERRTIAASAAPTTLLTLQQARHALDAATDKDALFAEAEKIMKTADGCKDLAAKLAPFKGWEASDLGAVDVAKAPSWMAASVRWLQKGQVSAPIPTQDSLIVLFACDRQDKEGGGIDRTAITNSLGQEKIERAARRLLRDLRRAAYIEVRA